MKIKAVADLLISNRIKDIFGNKKGQNIMKNEQFTKKV